VRRMLRRLPCLILIVNGEGEEEGVKSLSVTIKDSLLILMKGLFDSALQGGWKDPSDVSLTDPQEGRRSAALLPFCIARALIKLDLGRARIFSANRCALKFWRGFRAENLPSTFRSSYPTSIHISKYEDMNNAWC
jgi:hypothetical protein